jgi:hypothetical protein
MYYGMRGKMWLQASTKPLVDNWVLDKSYKVITNTSLHPKPERGRQDFM